MKARMLRRIWLYVLLAAFFWLADAGPDLIGLFRESFRQRHIITYYTYASFHYGIYHAGSLIASVLPCGLLFCEEWRSKAFLPTLARYGKSRYLYRIMLKPALMGGAVMAGGFLMYVFILRTQIPFYSQERVEVNSVLSEAYGEMLYEGSGFAYYGMKAVFLFLKGLFYTGFAMIISLYYPNPYVTAVSGFALSRLFRALNKTGTLTSYWNPDFLLEGQVKYHSSPQTLLLAFLIVILTWVLFFSLGRKGLEKCCEEGNHE